MCPGLISRRLRQRRTGWRFESRVRSVEIQIRFPHDHGSAIADGFAGRVEENAGPAAAVDILGSKFENGLHSRWAK